MDFKQYYISQEKNRILSEKETKELFIRYYNGDMQARQELIERNTRLVFDRVSKRFSHLLYDRDDLISIGMIGLIKAVERFDLSRGSKFSHWATTWIEGEIYKFCQKDCKHWDNVNLTSFIVETELGELDKSESCLRDDSNYLESIEDDSENKYIVSSLFDKLSSRDSEIIKLYYGFYNNKCYTQEEIAKILNMTRANVGMIIIKTLKKFKSELGIIDNDLEKNIKHSKTLK